jgi:hypothetical protein
MKSLARIGPSNSAPHRAQIVERAAEIGRVGEHADRVGDAAHRRARARRVDADRADRAARRRGALDLHDEARAGPRQRRPRLRRVGSADASTDTPSSRPRRLALARDDFGEDPPSATARLDESSSRR